MPTDCSQQFTFWSIGKQEVTARFDGGRVVSDAGLLSIREMDKKLRILAGLAERLPDPRRCFWNSRRSSTSACTS